MEDYLLKAKQHISQKFGDEVSILEESVVDSERFYSFTFQSKEYIRNRNTSALLGGNGYIVINKKDNRFFSLGSRYSLNELLEILTEKLTIEERIIKYKPQFELKARFDIQVNAIKKRQVLIEKLEIAQLTYVIPEIVEDSIFRIPKIYNKKLLEKSLNNLPAVFRGVNDGLQLIDHLLTSDCCEFDLLEHKEMSLAKYADKATDEDLKPIW